MSKSLKGVGKAGIAAAAVSLTFGTSLVLGAGAASATADFDLTRVSGQDRYETAGAIFDRGFADTSTVILANGEKGHFPDALVANYLAGVKDAPILLTRVDKTPPATAKRLAGSAKTVIIIGGTGAVSAAQEAQLKADGHTVQRLAGDNRYDTAAEVIKAAGAPASDTALVTTGLNFPDALAAGPLSVHEGMPLAISRTADIDDDEVKALADSGVTKFVVVGGASVVSQAVIDELEAANIKFDRRLSGDDRVETSVAVANYAVDTLNFENDAVNVASGYVGGTGADALAGGPLTGQQVRPLLITKSNLVSGASLLGFLRDNANTLKAGLVFGGPGAVSDAMVSEMEKAGQSVTSNQSYAITPTDKATLTFSTTDDPGTTADESKQGERTYSVSGLDDTKTYDIALFDAANVKVTSDGFVTFADENVVGGDNQADQGTVDARITSVNNGAAITLARTEAKPVNGVIKFTVNSLQADDVVPVVWLDAAGGTADALDLKADNSPSESFAIGGETAWTAPVAGNTANVNGTVSSVDKTNNTVTFGTGAGARVYSYDTNDEFYLSTAPAQRISIEDFEAALSRGDNLRANPYYSSASLPSKFTLANNAPAAPQTVSATAGTEGQATNDITVVVTPAAGTTVASNDAYVIQRAPVTGAGVGTFATVATVTPAQDQDKVDATLTYVDMNVAPGTYQYQVAAVVDGEQGAFTQSAPVASVAPSTDATAPTITDLRVTSDTVPNGVLNGATAPAVGDEVTFIFSEDVRNNTGATRSFTITDAQGETFTVSGTTAAPADSTTTARGNDNATANADLIAFTVTSVTKTGGIGDGFANLPAALNSVDASFRDVAGNQVNVAGSADKVVDVE